MAWDSSFEAAPGDESSPSGVDDAIRLLKTETRTVVGDEHEFDTAETGRQGEHKEGSAKAYFQEDETAPTTRPGGASLNADDAGRINVVTNEDLGVTEADVWDGSEWQPIAPGPMTGVIAMFAADPNTGLRTAQWLLCNGQAVAASTYPALYHHLTGGLDTGNAYVPDLRGMFVRGVDKADGVDPDDTRTPNPTAPSAADRYNVQADQVEEHDHQLEGSVDAATTGVTVEEGGAHSHTFTTDYGGSTGPDTYINQDGKNADNEFTTDEAGVHDHTVTDPGHSHTLTEATAGTTEATTNVMGSETRPINVALYYYIHI